MKHRETVEYIQSLLRATHRVVVVPPSVW